MLLPGFGGEPTRVPTADRRGGASIVGLSLRGWEGPGAWPYVAGDFSREDEADDAIKYASPSFASHVDAAASASLTQAYSAYFGSVAAGSPLAILDTAASWTSHYPPLPAGTRVAVHGLNAQELAANGAATEVAVGDLNKDPTLPYTDGEFDVVTNAASIAYLTRPRELFAEVHRVLKPGGLALVSFSNRVFAEKATALWLSKIDEDVALCSVVRAFFAFGPAGGWRNVSSVDLSPHPTEGDPLWMVTAVKA
ncbi:hypothetical protein EMIHUDRAFT_63771 [Emiliania huxleyi CCMP1516]|uniref:Methyltransferase type 11 domain-containing protein n=3 Tax=Emiliania huxleyi TaxID=2903 RepID=A0A0D3J6H5_EMIH1|nr:hypothetical protein EMIHUDRAFT_75554 [Emiliania huxleyi CCMP1516]XP_005782456.1 hypothetical protein EMIHUDRAFT_63771 [Emiliania huxleyi CCMP1516]EOD19110.1 hypothetical protein EMIHUDRAFT_75554 [Emiliania huxleyi CCMP1516]EOD30027.1 hypothetical protein EMIHUDRAFT_63771 [Emiliania huxleyi CCMP1516]|eukprot:XP_005771539.1 hypothetical protein EMIHUDRAFT_75554 [Emiliania huxleyi CCMP1516]